MGRSILALAALAAVSPGVALGATREVCSGCTGSKYGTLSAAVSAANGGDTILISSNITDNVQVNNKDLIIQGSSSAIVVTGNATNVFNITGNSTVTIQNLTIEPSGSGRAILLNTTTNSTTTLTDLHVSTVSSNQVGVVLYITNSGPVTLSASYFDDITSTGTSGGCVYTGNDTLTISNTTFNDCDATSGYGGAIRLEGGDVVVTNTGGGVTFSNNNSQYGGAIQTDDGNSSLTITGATFTSNGATGGGGAISIYEIDVPVSITSSTFTSNSSTGSGGGGAIIVYQDTLTLTDDVFSSNSTTNGPGGAINMQTRTGTFTRSRFCSNTANGRGGAIAMDGQGSATNIYNGMFISNSATYGGAISDTTGTSPLVRSNLFRGNTASVQGGSYWTDNGGANQFDNNIVIDSQANYGAYNGGTTTYIYSQWNSNASGNAANATLDATNNLGDPLLVTRTSGQSIGQGCEYNFYVKQGSPTINDGNPSLSGSAEPDGTGEDIGMFSYPSGPSSTIWWADADGDGVRWLYDCNDNNAAIKPGASEVACNGVDDNCDGSNSELDSTGVRYADADGDGYGTTPSLGCVSGGYAAIGGDCNDANGAISPGASEICDVSNNDDDCDGAAEDADLQGATGKTTFYVDVDGDGYGGATTTQRCDAGTGFTATSTDCLDSNSAVHPGGTEACDASNLDEDCDTQADDNDSGGATGKVNYYADVDADGYGNASDAQSRCDATGGRVLDATDCLDTNAAAHPGATEVCDAGDVDEDCDGQVEDADASTSAATKTTFYIDADGDTYGIGTTTSPRCDAGGGYVSNNGDCNDANASVRPGGQEICDAGNVDEDCDSTSDDSDSTVSAATKTTFYRDADTDLFGSPSNTQQRCDVGGGYIVNNTDCNDAAPNVNPGASEMCDTTDVDEDCDGQADDDDTGASGKVNWYADADSDAYGATGPGTLACDAPITGARTVSGDCNDANAAINPGATELCDAVDRNCDGEVGNFDGDGDLVAGCAGDCNDGDVTVFPAAVETCNGVDNNCTGSEADANNKTNWYADTDADTYGASTAFPACTQPAGYVGNSTDCNDSNASIRPGAAEVCDGLDQDCDTLVDEGVQNTYYLDADADGFGGATTQLACNLPGGYSTVPGDCDDQRVRVNPSETESCNSIDDDCDSIIDEGVTTTFYADADADGYGNSAISTAACTAPGGYVASGTDCDDAANATHPGGTETCDGTDEDCDGQIDETASDRTLFYVDADDDGFGSSAQSVLACAEPAGYAGDDDDCNDADADINPDGTEVCNGLDDDCDGVVENGVPNSTYYRDADADGYGDSASTATACAAPSGYVPTGGDCVDSNVAVHPGAAEDCGGLDLDCDGDVDGPNPTDIVTWHVDGDGDGYGEAAVLQVSCTGPFGAVANGTDCNDADGTINPGEYEHCDDGVDEDCDGSTTDGDNVFTYYADSDGDGYGDVGAPHLDCKETLAYVDDASDCDDGDDQIHPGQFEICDDVDQDCDGAIDLPNPFGAPTWYYDNDGDGLGNANSTVVACDAPAGTVANDSDCDDNSASVGSAITFYADGDGDGYGTDSSTASACVAPVGFVAQPGDCDDRHSDVNPGVAEICDSLDQDCDTIVDEDAVDALAWYQDGDNDGYGLGTVVVSACRRPGGYTATPGDCDDTTAQISPSAPDQCDNLIDDNCNGEIDEDLTDYAWYVDSDSDGYGDATSAPYIDCAAPGADYVPNGNDCTDDDPNVNPNALESCDGIDQNCDAVIDNDADDASLWYVDDDGDGWGGVIVLSACEQPVGAVEQTHRGDCDDTQAAISPDAPEVCNLADDDCDQQVDEGAGTAFYADADQDGFGDIDTEVVACEQPQGTTDLARATDCDDDDAATYPGATEIPYDGIDEDCDGVDVCDVDGDGFDADELLCGGDDCGDEDAGVNPDAEDLPEDDIDQDCDGSDASVTGHDRPTESDTDAGPIAKGCTCDSQGSTPMAFGALLALAALVRRRR